MKQCNEITNKFYKTKRIYKLSFKIPFVCYLLDVILQIIIQKN